MTRTTAAVLLCTAFVASPLAAQTLRGSSTSVDRQYRVALQHDYSFLESTRDVNRFVDLGLLVPVKGGANYEIHAVSFPYARPAVRTFVDRLSGQYRSACGEQLVVTSLTRPESRQPRNASSQSVHPAGMAVDLRISNKSSCRRWLESTLLSLEKSGVLEATRERYPAHYHVAVFPQQYLSYVAALESRASARLASNTTSSSAKSSTATVAAPEPASSTPSAAAAAGVDEAPAESAPADAGVIDYRVNRGDSLWSIAQRYGTSIAELKQINGLRTSRIKAGQVLVVPANQQ